MHTFEPIAIVARACVLPQALTPESFYAHLRQGHDFLTSPPEGRWRMDSQFSLDPDAKDAAWSDRGSYVRGFEAQFESSAYRSHPDLLGALDPMFKWNLQACVEAWTQAGFERDEVARAGVVLGNLSFPSAHMTKWAEHTWLKEQDPKAYEAMGWGSVHPFNRFMSGYPAHLVANELGLEGDAYCLDAACASSLYAVSMAARALHQRRADVMIAGAIQGADSLFLHVGFCALRAMSRSGQSRPFHAHADGLIPAEGAVSLVLMRLEDAVAQGRPIQGVIRGVGLSNDGRGRGFLAPSSVGQQRAIRAAYAHSGGLSPQDIQYVECHATGTTVGDRTELESMANVWNGHEVTVGSHKSNLGHAITSAGLVGTLKVLESMSQGVIPRTIHLNQGDLMGAVPEGITVAHDDVPWYSSGKRRAAVSAFGFGGNNAHMVLEQWSAGDEVMLLSALAAGQSTPTTPTLAVVAMEVVCGDGEGTADFAHALFDHAPITSQRTDIDMNLMGLRFPPNDLKEANAQQWLILKAARALMARGVELDGEQTSVVVGMQCDTMALRYGARWRLAQWAHEVGYGDEWVEQNREALINPLVAQSVLGTMPNIPANRLNIQCDALGPSFTVSDEERSGIRSIEVARDLIAHGEATTVLVGAVEMGADALHEQACEDAFYRETKGLDAACVLVVKDARLAREQGDEILALLDGADDAEGVVRLGQGQRVDLTTRLGHAHSAQSMLDVAAAILSVRHQRPLVGYSATSALLVESRTWSEQHSELLVSKPQKIVPTGKTSALQWVAISGKSRQEIRAKIEQGDLQSIHPDDPVRLSCVVEPNMVQTLHKRLFRRLDQDAEGVVAKVALFDAPYAGRVAWTFAGSGATTPERLQALWRQSLGVFDGANAWFEHVITPGVMRQIEEESSRVRPWSGAEVDLVETLSMSVLHASWSRALSEGLPEMAAGFSLGESSALFALGIWDGLEGMIERLVRTQIFERDVVGTHDALKKVWFDTDRRALAWSAGNPWVSRMVLGPVDELQEHMLDHPDVYLTMVHTADHAVVAGPQQRMESFVASLHTHAQRFIVRDVHAEASVHCESVRAIERAYTTLHTKEVSCVETDVYGHGTYSLVEQTPKELAQNITDQASHTVDFPRMVERLYNDGARIFIEHGPGGHCTRATRSILGTRDHLALSYDRAGASPEVAAFEVALTLWSAGQQVNLDLLKYPARVTFEEAYPATSFARTLTRAAHEPAVHFEPAADAPLDSRETPEVDQSSSQAEDFGEEIGSEYTPSPMLSAFQASLRARMKALDDMVDDALED